jgi:hypothetical protein
MNVSIQITMSNLIATQKSQHLEDDEHEDNSSISEFRLN